MQFRNRTLCPLHGNCLQIGVVYQATVTQTNTMREDIYIGIIENGFKTRYNQHTSSFRLSHKSSATSLSGHIWKLKENNTDHTVTWKILEKAQPYSPTPGKCNLCTKEKAYIAYTHPSLNKRRELFSTCPHRRKHLLSNLKSEEKKKPQAAVHQAAVHQDLLKRTDQNVRPQLACRGKKMYVDLYVKIVICSSILLSTLFYIAKNSTKSIYICLGDDIICKHIANATTWSPQVFTSQLFSVFYD